MKLKLGAEVIELGDIELSLSLNAVPRLRLLIKERLDKKGIDKFFLSHERGILEWQDDTLEVLPYSFTKNDDEAILYALLLSRELEGWLTTKPIPTEDLRYGIYQNQSEVGGWTFLNSTLAHQVLVPINDYKERIDKILPIASCLLRPIHQDNQQFLYTLIGNLQLHLPELAGFSAIHAEEEALRLIFFDKENAFELDSGWENLSAKLPMRFRNDSEPITIQKTGLEVNSGKKMALLKELAAHGQTTPLSDYLTTGSEADLVYLPGAVKLAGIYYLCEEVSYRFEDESHDLILSLTLVSSIKPQLTMPLPTMLEGQFKAWDADDSEEIRVFLTPPEASSWQLMDPKDSNLLKTDADLMAAFLLPSTPKDNYSEFYIRHVEGDKLVFKAQAFAMPQIYGSKQKLFDKQEASSLSLNSEILALSTAEKDADINSMQGLIGTAKTLVQRLTKEVKQETGTITQAQNVQIEESKLSIASKTDIAKTTTVKKVKVSGIAGMAVIAGANISYPISVKKMGVDGIAAISSASASSQNASQDDLSWISFSLLDEEGNPLKEKNYRIVLTDGRIVKGVIPADGKVEIHGIPAGICDIRFYDIADDAAFGLVDDWIEIQLVDEDNNPVAEAVFRLVQANGDIVEDKLDKNGFARVENIWPGECQISFPGLENAVWDSEAAVS